MSMAIRRCAQHLVSELQPDMASLRLEIHRLSTSGQGTRYVTDQCEVFARSPPLRPVYMTAMSHVSAALRRPGPPWRGPAGAA